MFSKLRNLSEDLAKSINLEFTGEGVPGGPRRATDTTKILKNGEEVLHRSTPAAADLTQPQDEPPAESQPIDSKDGSPAAKERPTTPIEDLPPDIRLKMKKFAKYEEKYPVLLEAYKVEKRKSELITMFEKILQESTPVSSILEAGALVEYLNGLTEKASMLNSELRRVTSERGKLERRVGEVERSEIELKGKIEQLGESKVELEAKLMKTQVELQRLNEETIQKASSTDTDTDTVTEQTEDSAKVEKLASEVKSLKCEISSLTQKLEQAEKEREIAILDANSKATALEEAQSNYQKLRDLEDSKQLKQDLESASSEIRKLKASLSEKSKEIELKLAEKDDQLVEKDKNMAEVNTDLIEKVELLDLIQKEHSEMKQKFESTIQELEAKIVSNVEQSNSIESNDKPSASPVSASSKKNKKKKKAGKLVANVETKSEINSEKPQTDNLLEETRKELHQVKEQLAQKTDDVEELRDLLRDLGDELVVAKDKLKEFANNKKSIEDGENFQKLSQEQKEKITLLETTVVEKEAEIRKLKTVLEANETKISELTSNISQLEEDASMKEKEVESSKSLHSTLANEHKLLQENVRTSQESISVLNKELTALKTDKASYESRIAELQKFKSNDASLKLEVSNLKSTQAKKESAINALSEKLNALTLERDNLKALQTTLEEKLSQTNEMNKNLVNEKSQLVTKQELAFEREKRLSEEILKLQTDKNKVVTDLEGIRNKFDILSKQRANTTDEAQTLRQQFDELHMKTREQTQRIESLEDDLNESRNLLQERTRELLQLRRVLLDAEDQASLRASEIKTEMSKLNEDRVEFEKQAQALLKKKQREVDEAKLISSNYLLKIQELEGVLSELRSKTEKGDGDHDLQSSDGQLIEAQKTIETLQALLQTQTKRSKEFENLNGVLKKLNEEANQKFERLQKNYKIVLQQYSKAKEDASESAKQHSSIPVAVESNPSSERSQEENIAYLKNVLLGYVEHKEQRESLLPVLRMLFHFTPQDESKFAQALK